MAEYATPEEEWHDFLSGTHPHLQDKSPLRLIPSKPRCKLCKAPFGSPGRFILGRYGYQPWVKQPKICGRCFKGLGDHAQMCPGAPESQGIRGGEVEISMLFADVRGSSKLAREMPVIDFTRLMNRFYRESSRVLIDGDAIIEKFVGDEIVGVSRNYSFELTVPGGAVIPAAAASWNARCLPDNRRLGRDDCAPAASPWS